MSVDKPSDEEVRMVESWEFMQSRRNLNDGEELDLVATETNLRRLIASFPDNDKTKAAIASELEDAIEKDGADIVFLVGKILGNIQLQTAAANTIEHEVYGPAIKAEVRAFYKSRQTQTI